MLHSAFPNVVLCFDCVVCSGDGSRSMQDEKSSVSQPSPATLLLLFLLFDLQLSCLFNLLLCPLRFFGDGMLLFLFLYRLCREKHSQDVSSNIVNVNCISSKLHIVGALMGYRLPREDRCLPFLSSSLTSFS